MEKSETNAPWTPFSRLKNLFQRQRENDYDRIVFNIRVLTLLVCILLNAFKFLTISSQSFLLCITTFGSQLLHLFVQVYYKNNYVTSIIYQINALIYMNGLGSNPTNVVALPTTILSTYALYSIQFYPVTMNFIFLSLSVHYIFYYRDLAVRLFDYDHNIVAVLKPGADAWITAIIILFVVFNAFQTYNAKVWKAYTSTKQLLVEKNQELNQANQKMEEMVQTLQETNQKLELTNKNLSEALKAQDLFVACVSHELRTPLNAMIGNIELMQLEMTDPVKKKMLKTCRICGEILLVMINNILDVAKIHASKLEINVSAMNMSHFIEKIWSVSCPKILQKDLEGKLLISKNVPLWLKGDFHRLIQIIINLVGNATKFTTKGGVRVMISWESEDDSGAENTGETFATLATEGREGKSDSNRIGGEHGLVNRVFTTPTVTYQMARLNHEKSIQFSEKDDDYSILQQKLRVQSNTKGTLKVQVIDTGCGIPTDAHSRIFEPFVQADSSITRKYGGTGLGLYIIKEVLNKMNGTITVSSKQNEGARFTIKIPLSTISPEEASYSKMSLYQTSQILLKYTGSPVLIVDDSPYNQTILKTYLDTIKIPSETADNGLEALNKVKAHPPGYYSMIMMDIQMPVMDGITASKKIRQHERENKISKMIPIIVVTANCTSAEQNECMATKGEIKASYFFRKPFSYNDCRLSVETILSQKSRKPKKVLVVDDDAFNRELLQTQMKKLGLECESGKNGFEALQKLKEDPDIAIVLTDFEMPGMNGIEVARRIRQELKLKDLYIVGVTGNVEEEMNKLSLVNGMNKVLTKPVSLNQISLLFKEYGLV